MRPPVAGRRRCRRRGADALADIGVLPGFAGTIVHDGWTPYETIDGDTTLHAQCGVHLIRHLKLLCDGDPAHAPYARWASQLVQILIEASAHATTAAAAGQPRVPARLARRIRTRYAQTIAVAYTTLPAGLLRSAELPHCRSPKVPS